MKKIITADGNPVFFLRRNNPGDYRSRQIQCSAFFTKKHYINMTTWQIQAVELFH
ncbi:hypothetical protein WDV93_17190 [Pantoea ananatis]